jgi:hypothetical protein
MTESEPREGKAIGWCSRYYSQLRINTGRLRGPVQRAGGLRAFGVGARKKYGTKSLQFSWVGFRSRMIAGEWTRLGRRRKGDRMVPLILRSSESTRAVGTSRFSGCLDSFALSGKEPKEYGTKSLQFTLAEFRIRLVFGSWTSLSASMKGNRMVKSMLVRTNQRMPFARPDSAGEWIGSRFPGRSTKV